MRNDTVHVENYPIKSIKPAGIRCMGQAAQIGLLGLSLQELTLLAEEAGQPGFRGRQLFEALYRQRVESAGQVCAVLNDQHVSPPQDRVNLVFMGMGEPFLNYDNFMKSVRLLVEGVGIPESRMTVSTAGIVPRIYDFGTEPVRPKLAISLNASNDELRTRLMPINRKWNLEKLMAAARDFPLRNRERLTFEYVLLDEVNDSAQNAREVVELIRGMRAKVNLIALNPGPGIAFQTPSEQRVLAFQNILVAAGIPAFIRRPRGRDIFAACGQLKRTSGMTG